MPEHWRETTRKLQWLLLQLEQKGESWRTLRSEELQSKLRSLNFGDVSAMPHGDDISYLSSWFAVMKAHTFRFVHNLVLESESESAKPR